MSDKNNRGALRSSPILQVILSVVCAIALWLYVMSVESPIYTETFTGVPVELRNSSILSSNGLSVLTGHGTSVDVTVTGRRSQINSLSTEDFAAYADLSTISAAGEYALEIKVDPEVGVTVSELSENTVLVYADVTTTKTVTISTDITYYAGITAEVGYSMGKPYIVPTATMPDVTTTTISGPVSVLSNVDHARVKAIDIGAVSIGAATGSISYNDGELQLVDVNGAIVDNPHIKASNTSVTVNFPIIMEKSVPLEPDYSEDYTAADYSITLLPSKVTVKGEKSVISALDKLTFAIEGSPEDNIGDKSYDLPLIEGVEITGAVSKVTVSVSETKSEKSEK